jgi:8-oxo-dGTP diphosphatase
MKKGNFEICTRGIIVRGNKILICKAKSKSNYFFPGGHVEFGEKADAALARELKEEIGVSVKKAKFAGTNENLYQQGEKLIHELNVVFEVRLGKKIPKVLEDHLKFQWMDLKSLPKMKVYPTSLKNAILDWRKNKKTFWSSQGFKK